MRRFFFFFFFKLLVIDHHARRWSGCCSFGFAIIALLLAVVSCCGDSGSVLAFVGHDRPSLWKSRPRRGNTSSRTSNKKQNSHDDDDYLKSTLSLFSLSSAASSSSSSADITIQRGCQFYSIHYDLVLAKDDDDDVSAPPRPPVVVLHGGPGVPSNYLRPLETIVVDKRRPLLFWDQLGCGKSDRPDDESVYSIDLYVDDLVQLLEEVLLLEMPYFHLYGQSFGGILAFEYLKRERPENCLSVVLSSTPTNVAQVEEEANRLRGEIQLAEGNTLTESVLGEAFRKRHQVQTEVQPKVLKEAYAEAGTVFRGTTAIADYCASLVAEGGGQEGDGDLIETPALVLRGENDFVTLPCIEGWKELFQEVTVEQLDGCSHHGMLERPEAYGHLLESFWKSHEGRK